MAVGLLGVGPDRGPRAPVQPVGMPLTRLPNNNLWSARAATIAATVRSSRSAGGSRCGGRLLMIWPMSLYSSTTPWQ